MELEYGRKIISHLFKRNNYKTMVVGKPQPVETNIQWNNKVSSSFIIKIDFFSTRRIRIIYQATSLEIGDNGPPIFKMPLIKLFHIDSEL